MSTAANPKVDPAELKGRKLGRVLTKMGKVTREQVHEALAIQQTRKVPIGQLLVELGYCSAEDVAAGLAGQAGMGYMDLKGWELPDRLKEVIPTENVRAYEVIPVEYNPTSKRLKIAMKTPNNFRAVDDLRSGSRVLIMSFSHAEDLDIVARCLHRLRQQQDLPFIGLIGSRTKWSVFRRRLAERGFTEGDMDRVTCPIGVPGIPGKQPAVIAASVAAQLLMLG